MSLKPGVNIADSEHKETVFKMVEDMRAVVAPTIGDNIEVHASLAMTAASIVAGIHYSGAVAAGIQKDTPTARKQLKRMLMRNFDAGVDIGLRAASRTMKERGEMQ